MISPILSFQALILPSILLISISSSYITLVVSLSTVRGGSRSLLSFRETPGGGNVTFECSPSGPCVPCLYSEKREEKFRCSETGYRIPLKCVEVIGGPKKSKGKKSKKNRSTLEVSSVDANANSLLLDEDLSSLIKSRRLLEDSPTPDDKRQAYTTYRSCIPAVNEEKLSVIGFEGIMLCLVLSSGSFIYFRRKRAVTMPVGAVRIPSNSRF